jgi:predicted nuclease of predicted toxin-antitoxin system
VKLLIDVNLSPRWVPLLSQQGMLATHWSTQGPLDAPDTVIMAHAKTHDHIVLTHDLDFSAILAATNDGKPSVIQIRAADVSPELNMAQVLIALRQMKTELQAGALITIDPGRTRLRILPLAVR